MLRGGICCKSIEMIIKELEDLLPVLWNAIYSVFCSSGNIVRKVNESRATNDLDAQEN
jgi:hypothetical protein